LRLERRHRRSRKAPSNWHRRDAYFAIKDAASVVAKVAAVIDSYRERATESPRLAAPDDESALPESSGAMLVVCEHPVSQSRITTETGMDDRSAQLRTAFAYVTTLFFAWGFITSTIDPLIPAVKSIFDLSYTEAFLSQFAFFMAYGVISLPAAWVVSKLDAPGSISLALGTMVLGCLLFPVAVLVDNFEVVLLALFVLGAGITLLQVAANPLAAVLGPPERSHFRLTFSQAFNSLGTVLGPYIVGRLILEGGVFSEDATAAASAAGRAESLGKIEAAFVVIAAVIVVLGLALWRARQRIVGQLPPQMFKSGSIVAAFKSKWAVLGAVAIFLYVGAEVSIGSIMISFLVQPEVLGVTHREAATLLPLYWGGAMVGRFIGSALLRRVPAGRLLAIAAFTAGTLCLFVTQASGTIAAVAVLAVGLFNSIMFPTIFTLTLEHSTAPPSSTSGLLCMAIIGGALLPVLFAAVVDARDISTAFFVPMLAYWAIGIFGLAIAAAAIARIAGVRMDANS
jgi:FHS family L-fucose permease-like MFS transporter